MAKNSVVAAEVVIAKGRGEGPRQGKVAAF